MKQTAITIDRDILGGTAVFAGTRVPVQALFDYLQGDETLEEFLENFPTVTREQALEVLRLAETLLTSQKILNENSA
jgi:uncharacterized protein (DUF433 family)